MRSLLSPVISNLYMENFETKAKSISNPIPKCSLRYIDDMFFVWPPGEEALSTFLDHLICIQSSINVCIQTWIKRKNSISWSVKRQADWMEPMATLLGGNLRLQVDICMKQRNITLHRKCCYLGSGCKIRPNLCLATMHWTGTTWTESLT